MWSCNTVIKHRWKTLSNYIWNLKDLFRMDPRSGRHQSFTRRNLFAFPRTHSHPNKWRHDIPPPPSSWLPVSNCKGRGCQHCPPIPLICSGRSYRATTFDILFSVVEFLLVLFINHFPSLLSCSTPLSNLILPRYDIVPFLKWPAILEINGPAGFWLAVFKTQGCHSWNHHLRKGLPFLSNGWQFPGMAIYFPKGLSHFQK